MKGERKLRIANVIHHISGGGGVASQAMKMARKYVSLGHSPYFATLGIKMKEPNNKSLGRFATVVAGRTSSSFNPLNPIILKNLLIEIVKKNECDIIQSFDPMISGLAAVLSRKHLVRTPSVLRLGTNYPAHFNFSFRQDDDDALSSKIRTAVKLVLVLPTICQIERLTINCHDAIVANCEYLAKIYEPRLRNPRRIHVIKNGVDINLFTPHGPKYPLPKKKKKILYLGRIERRKGIHNLISALPSVFSQFPDASLYIVGKSRRISYLSYIKNLISMFDLDSRVHFIGSVENKAVPSILRAADVLVLPSDTASDQVEGLPNVILEAMACGVPVIATNVCGVPEVIKHHETGILVRPGSVEDITSALLEVLSSKSLANNLGSQGREFVSIHNTLDRSVRRYIQLYKELIGIYKD
jgi:glycosyltransferase involved in cell wall biosynthesis